jgi:nucleotide-binding universal stress UspA family protein
MDRAKKILAPTDFSELSKLGVRHALEMARFQGADVTVYHVANYKEVFPYPPSSEEGTRTNYLTPGELLTVHELNHRKELMDTFLTENFSGLTPNVKVHSEVDIGLPYEMIVKKAAKERMDLIVMSTHGTTGLQHMLIGSVTEQVIRRATCPVLSVHPQKEANIAEVRATL